MLLKFLHVTSCLYSQHVTLLAFFISSYHLLHFFTSPSSFLHITFFMSLLVHYRDQKKKKQPPKSLPAKISPCDKLSIQSTCYPVHSLLFRIIKTKKKSSRNHPTEISPCDKLSTQSSCHPLYFP